jgi:hypothetical protein
LTASSQGFAELLAALMRLAYLKSFGAEDGKHSAGMAVRTALTINRGYSWLIMLARQPAPKPLSIFTTLTPLAQAPVAVNFGKAQVLKGLHFQGEHSLVHRARAAAGLFQNAADLLLVQKPVPFSVSELVPTGLQHSQP